MTSNSVNLNYALALLNSESQEGVKKNLRKFDGPFTVARLAAEADLAAIERGETHKSSSYAHSNSRRDYYGEDNDDRYTVKETD